MKKTTAIVLVVISITRPTHAEPLIFGHSDPSETGFDECHNGECEFASRSRSSDVQGANRSFELSFRFRLQRDSTGDSQSVMLVASLPLERIFGPKILARTNYVAPNESTPMVKIPFAFDPTIVPKLVRQAMATAGLVDDDDLESMKGRARWSAFLPDVRLRAQKGADLYTRIYDSTATASTSGNDSNTSIYEVRLSFKLDRLLFADQEIAIERLRLSRIEERQKIRQKLIEILGHYERAMLVIDAASVGDLDRANAQLEAFEALQALDVMTGGAASTILLAAGPLH
jgi:hypothetical protein